MLLVSKYDANVFVAKNFAWSIDSTQKCFRLVCDKTQEGAKRSFLDAQSIRAFLNGLFTGWRKSNGYNSEISISDPMLVKPKCVWEEEISFERLKKQLKNVNKFSKIEKKTFASQTRFGFTNIGSETHILRGIAIWNQL